MSNIKENKLEIEKAGFKDVKDFKTQIKIAPNPFGKGGTRLAY